MQRHVIGFGKALRPGAMLGIIVAAIVAMVGLVQLDQRLMVIGLLAGPIILIANAVVVAVSRWHVSNTQPGALYVDAERLVELEWSTIRRRVRK